MVELLEHPAERRNGDPVSVRIHASCSRTNDDDLVVAFRITAGDEAVVIPPARETAFLEGLWHHTCFEVFVAPGDGPAYHEYNLSPSGEWGLFSFREYRAGQANPDPAFAPLIRWDGAPGAPALHAELPAARLLGTGVGGPLRIGLSAVIERSDGAILHWALRHPARHPDFHHAESFALCVEAKSEA